MRRVISTYISRHGNPVAIYAIHGAAMRNKEIEVGAIYEIVYRLGLGDNYLKAELIMATDDNRTLFFRNPTEPTKAIGVPVMNILKYVKK